MAPRIPRNLSLIAAFLALAAAAQAGALVEERALSPHPVTITKQETGFAITAPTYQAMVADDGNLHSLRIGDADLLDDRVGLSLGAFYYSDSPLRSDAPLKLPQVTNPDRSTIEATDGDHAIRYRFEARYVAITLVNRSAVPVAYFVVLSSDVTIVRNLQTGEAAASPANVDWPEASFHTRRGEYLVLRGGSRIWGPWLDRQVWEVARVPARGQVQIVMEGGKGEQPKATLEQLLGLRVSLSTAAGPRPRGLTLTAEVENRADEGMEGVVSMELSACRSELVMLASSSLALPPKQVVPAHFQARVEAPDFYTARVSITAQGRQVAKTTVVTGYRVRDIVPAPVRPADFTEFWQRLVAEARENAPGLQLVLDGTRSTAEARVFLVSYPGLSGKTISGWYVTPVEPGRYPALLCLSGYGARDIQPPLFLARKGYAVLAIDVRGNAVDKHRVKPYEDYCTLGIESPGTYVYREIAGQALRGLWALSRREEVDPDRVGIAGVSEGGGLGLLLATLEPRVRAVSADAPMLVDFPLSTRRAKWPYKRIAQYLQAHPDQGAQVAATLSYFDVLNAAPDVPCPVLLSVGLLDQVSLPAAVYGLYNLLDGPKEIRTFPKAGHEGGGQDWWTHKLTWLEKQLAPRPQPALSPPLPAMPQAAPIAAPSAQLPLLTAPPSASEVTAPPTSGPAS